jgi:hypothetical protein
VAVLVVLPALVLLLADVVLLVDGRLPVLVVYPADVRWPGLNKEDR